MKKYNKKEQLLRYIVALTDIRKNYLVHNKFWCIRESTEKHGIGTIPKDCLFDIVDQKEITEEYVHTVLNRRIKHYADYKREHAPKPQERPQTLFDSYALNQEPSEKAQEVVLTEEACINFLKDKGYQIYKRYC